MRQTFAVHIVCPPILSNLPGYSGHLHNLMISNAKSLSVQRRLALKLREYFSMDRTCKIERHNKIEFLFWD